MVRTAQSRAQVDVQPWSDARRLRFSVPLCISSIPFCLHPRISPCLLIPLFVIVCLTSGSISSSAAAEKERFTSRWGAGQSPRARPVESLPRFRPGQRAAQTTCEVLSRLVPPGKPGRLVRQARVWVLTITSPRDRPRAKSRPSGSMAASTPTKSRGRKSPCTRPGSWPIVRPPRPGDAALGRADVLPDADDEPRLARRSHVPAQQHAFAPRRPAAG